MLDSGCGVLACISRLNRSIAQPFNQREPYVRIVGGWEARGCCMSHMHKHCRDESRKILLDSLLEESRKSNFGDDDDDDDDGW